MMAGAYTVMAGAYAVMAGAYIVMAWAYALMAEAYVVLACAALVEAFAVLAETYAALTAVVSTDAELYFPVAAVCDKIAGLGTPFDTRLLTVDHYGVVATAAGESAALACTSRIVVSDSGIYLVL